MFAIGARHVVLEEGSERLYGHITRVAIRLYQFGPVLASQLPIELSKFSDRFLRLLASLLVKLTGGLLEVLERRRNHDALIDG